MISQSRTPQNAVRATDTIRTRQCPRASKNPHSQSKRPIEDAAMDGYLRGRETSSAIEKYDSHLLNAACGKLKRIPPGLGFISPAGRVIPASAAGVEFTLITCPKRRRHYTHFCKPLASVNTHHPSAIMSGRLVSDKSYMHLLTLVCLSGT